MAEIFGHLRRFREKMDAREALVAGPFVSLADPTASEALAGTVDFLWCDPGQDRSGHVSFSPTTHVPHIFSIEMH
jgi:hypothetical protein